jgi:hypothetical protein
MTQNRGYDLQRNTLFEEKRRSRVAGGMQSVSTNAGALSESFACGSDISGMATRPVTGRNRPIDDLKDARIGGASFATELRTTW